MPHYGILREYRFEGEVDDVRGAEVYGVNDEKLGKIDDVIFDHSSGDIRYLVLNTGGLFSRKKIMVPANRISPYGNHDDKFYAELDKERLEMLPEFDERLLAPNYDWAEYEKNYEKQWHEGSVLYNKDTNRIITPPIEEVEGVRRQPLSPRAQESLKQDFTPQRVGKEDDLLGVSSGTTGKTTLQPSKPAKAGREDAEFRRGVPQREVMNPIAGEIPKQQPAVSGPETMREPGVYTLERPPGERGGIDETSTHGRRLVAFQQRLREHREKVIKGCVRCSTKERVA
ncbi:MAG TPA: PRC-barrel domain-containing protein [Candidatus Angelobacter sp.]|nr:PRC-barrel domain-containing protein [Candidatus Angelobacter sp.]